MTFWLCLGTSAVLFATVVAAPRVTEWKRLERRWLRSSEQVRELKADIQHLQLLKDSMQNDPEFASRVARDELNLSSMRGQLFEVEASLGFDPRERQMTATQGTGAGAPLAEAWYESWLADLSQPTVLRTRWLLCAGGLCLLSFVFLHDNVFSGRVGRDVANMLHQVLRRYNSVPESGEK